MVCPILTAAEGFVLGVGAKMFTIAGPVIVYGVVASVVYGVIYWITTLFCPPIFTFPTTIGLVFVLSIYFPLNII